MSAPHEDFAAWSENRRLDGAAVVQGVEGLWFVMPPDGRRPVVFCPCCDRAFASASEAKRAADYMYRWGLV